MLVQANQSLLFLLNAVSLAEKQQIPILKSLALPKAKKKICVFTVTRPTLIFASDPINFYTEFGKHFCCLISNNVLFIQPLAFCRN
jgi:hypothetical protein